MYDPLSCIFIFADGRDEAARRLRAAVVLVDAAQQETLVGSRKVIFSYFTEDHMNNESADSLGKRRKAAELEMTALARKSNLLIESINWERPNVHLPRRDWFATARCRPIGPSA